MKKLSVILLVLNFVIVCLQAQQMNSGISFDNLNFDYGKINEENGPVDHRFIFTNTGTKPVLITNVRPSCGCTTSDYTKQPVAPGEKGYVNARYDPKNRPGPFNKSITVTTNTENPITLLKISGEVIPKSKPVNVIVEQPVEKIYPILLSKVRLAKDNVAFPKIYNSEIKTETVEFINISDELVKIEFEKIPEFITMLVEPNVLKPKDKGIITINYDAAKVNDFGFVINKVIIRENGEINKDNRITVSANIYEDFSKLSEEDKMLAPAASFDKLSYSFGTINEGEVVDIVFNMINTGKSDLIIRKTKASCGCTLVKPAKEIIKPGESIEIKASFNSRGRNGVQTKNITITTNDPNNPNSYLKISGSVNAAPK